MRFGSLFSGIGGFDLGLERAGMECAWQVENNEFCNKVLYKHWPDVPKYGDIKDVGKENLSPVDLIAGGFPCQPFSNAGKQRGTEDDRHLWPEMLRVISELKPTWVIGENVPGIIPIFLDQAISDLEAEGYTCEAYVLPACAFDAPHRRDRLFIVAHSNCKQTNQQHSSARGFGLQRRNTLDTREEAPRQKNSETGNDNPSRLCAVLGDPSIEQVNECRNKSKESSARIPESRNPGSPNDAPDPNSKRSSKRNERGSAGKEKRKYKGGEPSGAYPTGNWRPLGVEPTIRGVVDGVPDRVDRLKSLGNAVVPQVAEHIGKIIIKANNLLTPPNK